MRLMVTIALYAMMVCAIGAIAIGAISVCSTTADDKMACVGPDEPRENSGRGSEDSLLSRSPFTKLDSIAFASDFSSLLPPEDVTLAANTNKKVLESMMTDELRLLRDRHGDSSSIYYGIPEEYYDDVVRIFPESLLALEMPRIEWQVIECEDILIPHADVERLSVVNIYVSVNGEETVFYQSNYSDFYVIKEMNNQMVFSVDWLTRSTYSFVAAANDVFVIDVTKIHSVNKCAKGQRRIAISCGFYLDYETLLSHLTTL
jgi:hypothetical protein